MPTALMRRLATTAIVSWLAVRVALGILGLISLSYLGAAGLIALVLFVGWLDLSRNTERILYANLAVSPVRISVIIVAVALAVEFSVGAPLARLLLIATEGPPP